MREVFNVTPAAAKTIIVNGAAGPCNNACVILWSVAVAFQYLQNDSRQLSMTANYQTLADTV